MLLVCFLVQVCLWEMLWHFSIHLLSRPLLAIRYNPFVTLSQSDQEMLHCFSSNEKKTIQNYFLGFSSVLLRDTQLSSLLPFNFLTSAERLLSSVLSSLAASSVVVRGLALMMAHQQSLCQIHCPCHTASLLL